MNDGEDHLDLEKESKDDFERHKDFYACVRSGDIGFYRGGSRIVVDMDDAGPFGWALCEHIARHARNGDEINLTVRWRTGLDHYLADFSMMTSFAEHAVQVVFAAYHAAYQIGLGMMQARVHIDADIDTIAQRYGPAQVTHIQNGLGQVVADVTSWASYLSGFEKDWNFVLCDAFAGEIGFPGYEVAVTEESFLYQVLQHASSVVIGTQEQLQRYRVYEKKFLPIAPDSWINNGSPSLDVTLRRFSA